MNRFIRQPTSIFQLRTPFFAAPPLPLLIRSFSYQPHLSRAVKKKKYLSFVLVIHSTTPSHALRKSLTIKWRPSTPFLTDFDSFPFCCHHSHASLSFIYVHHLFFFFFLFVFIRLIFLSCRLVQSIRFNTELTFIYKPLSHPLSVPLSYSLFSVNVI